MFKPYTVHALCRLRRSRTYHMVIFYDVYATTEISPQIPPKEKEENHRVDSVHVLYNLVSEVFKLITTIRLMFLRSFRVEYKLSLIEYNRIAV